MNITATYAIVPAEGYCGSGERLAAWHCSGERMTLSRAMRKAKKIGSSVKVIPQSQWDAAEFGHDLA